MPVPSSLETSPLSTLHRLHHLPLPLPSRRKYNVLRIAVRVCATYTGRVSGVTFMSEE